MYPTEGIHEPFGGLLHHRPRLPVPVAPTALPVAGRARAGRGPGSVPEAGLVQPDQLNGVAGVGAVAVGKHG